MTATKAPTPPAAAAAAPSNILTFLKWVWSWIVTIILAPFKGAWITLKATGRVTLWGLTLTKSALMTDAGIVIVSFAMGASAAHIWHMHNPQIAAPASVKTVTIPIVDAKTQAQIAVISGQVAEIKQLILKQPVTAAAPAVVAPVAVAPAAQPATPTPAVKHRAPSKKAASGWFQLN
jgi:hypothetical protein